jgi:hypothetical protein
MREQNSTQGRKRDEGPQLLNGITRYETNVVNAQMATRPQSLCSIPNRVADCDIGRLDRSLVSLFLY